MTTPTLIACETTNDEIERLAAEFRTAADEAHIILTDDPAEHLYEIREDALDAYISTKTAAALVGVETSYIRRLILAGKITAKKLGHDWLIEASDLRGIQRQRHSRK